MRLSSSQIYQQAVNAMLSKQAELAKTQLQLATGKRVLAPSDDPAAATQVINLNQAIETTAQYQRNSDYAETRLSIEETVLADVGNVLQRVRELSVRANNDTLSAGDRQAIADEVRTNLDAVFQLANNQDSSGEYLFSGYKTGTVPFTDDGSGNYTYQGDQGTRSLQVGANRQVSIGDAGNDVFMKVDDGAGGTINMFEMLNDIITSLEANNPTPTALTQLDSALDVVLSTRSTIGARMNTIDAQRNANDSFSLVLQENRSKLEDLDYAEAVSKFEQQILALQASQQSFVKIQGLSLFNYL
ncbi:Flagellar hook-associated protein FlgL [hydrothermal vent metagenome]|uniref:Flagellar hook-associated protein FlgL n=1 Tax=hydrothermal vent metagenome TaxID=652676 RepID=A0A3B0XBY4_9ZZZZ